MKEIIWLASYPKSGNTWVRLMINAYKTGNLDINNIETTTADTNKYHYQLVSPIPVSEMPIMDVFMMRNSALLHMQYQHRYRPVITKTHCANIEAISSPMIPPEWTKSAIHIVRDPRDVAISFANHMGKTIDETIDLMGNDRFVLGKGGKAPSMLCSWNKHTESWTGENKFPVINIRYEDIKRSPITCLTKIIEWLGLDVDQERIKKTVDMTTIENLKKEEDKRGFSEKSEHNDRFFRKGIVGEWVDVLTQSQASKIVNDHKVMMEYYNYV